MTSQYAARMSQVKPSAIRELLKLGADPAVISFGGGYPDPALFPFEQLRDVYDRAIADRGVESLQYALSDGLPRLREQVAERMRQDSIPCTVSNILITHGAQQGLDLVAKLLIDRGDIIATEDPTFVGGLIAFNPYEPAYVGIPMDADGMITDDLEEKLKAGLQIKLLYTIPDFQNPTGVTMTLERRQQLVDLANRYDFVILEDSPYRDIRFEGQQMPPLKSMDTEGRVIFLSSFSKVLAPGVRLGAVAASEEIVAKLGMLKMASDTQSSSINMIAVSLYLEKYDLDAHIAGLRTAYKRKKDLALETIAASFPASVSYTRPEGGLFTWLTFPQGFNTETFMAERMLPEIKVAFVPGESFYPNVGEINHARVNFSGVSDELIVRGLSELGQLTHSELASASVPA